MASGGVCLAEMALKNVGDGTLTKLAADANPTATLYPAGMYLQNTDDRKRWINSGTDWIIQEFIDYKKFNVHKDGANYYITDINHRVVGGASTDVAAIVNAHMLTQGVTAVWEYLWDASVFSIFQPMIIPPTVAGLKKYVHQGQGQVARRLVAPSQTSLVADASFPNNRYYFELNNPVATTSNTGYVKIDGFSGVNNTNYTTINVGFVKLEAGEGSNGQENWVVSNCHSNYLWRNLHLIGKVWHGRFENLVFTADNTLFSGDCDILLEDGGHTGGTNTTPKENRFYNIRNMHSEGTQVNSIRIQSAGYNIFSDIFIDGFKCSHSAICLNNTDGYSIHDNIFQNMYAIDMATPTPDTRESSLYLDGTNVHDNVFRVMRLPIYPETVKLVGTGVVSNDIEIAGYWGTSSRVTDTGTDGSNILRILPGNRLTGTPTPIIHTGALSRVVDDRKGSANGGSRFLNGTGAEAIVFHISYLRLRRG